MAVLDLIARGFLAIGVLMLLAGLFLQTHAMALGGVALVVLATAIMLGVSGPRRR
jgi:hypothetical protein